MPRHIPSSGVWVSRLQAYEVSLSPCEQASTWRDSPGWDSRGALAGSVELKGPLEPASQDRRTKPYVRLPGLAVLWARVSGR